MGDLEKTGQRATREERGYGQTTGIEGQGAQTWSRTRSPGMREGMKSEEEGGTGRDWGDTKGAPQRKQTLRIRGKRRWEDRPSSESQLWWEH